MRAHELLRDRGGPPAGSADGVDPRRDDRGRVEARVVPERLVLDRGRRIDEHRWDLVVRYDVTLELAEPGELGLPGPIEDDDLLWQLQVLELRNIGEPVGQGGVHGHRGD